MRHVAAFLGTGLSGFLADAGLTSLFAWAGAGPLAARLPAVACAVTLTFALNRRYAFGPGGRGLLHEFLRYCAVSAGGAALNVAVYAACLALVAGVETGRALHPALAVAAGSGAAMLLTYAGYRSFVFGGGAATKG